MGQDTKIQWTDATWPIVQGCDYVSPGCVNCYAVPLLHRMAHNPNPKVSLPIAGLVKTVGDQLRWTGKVALRHDRLMDPLSWRKPKMIFVPSHGDLFHEDVPDIFLRKVFAVMSLCGQHTFQVLTKRPDRMRAFFAAESNCLSSCQAELFADPVVAAIRTPAGQDRIRDSSAINGTYGKRVGEGNYWPLPNVWLGVSVEDQERADERIPLLLQTPAAIRFLSCEPLLGPLDLFAAGGLNTTIRAMSFEHQTGRPSAPWCDWVIAGGESGGNARPCNIAWLQSIVSQCQQARVSCFLKQLGSNVECIDVIDAADHFPGPVRLSEAESHEMHNARVHLKDHKGGDPDEWPADLRVREFPNE